MSTMSPASPPSPESGGFPSAIECVTAGGCGAATLPAQASGRATPDRPERTRILASVVGAHAVVDYYSFIIVSLLPLLATRLDLTNQQKAMVLGVGSIMSGFLQPVLAWVGDRHDSRAIAWIGLVVASVACSVVGLADGFWMLMLITAIGAAGVGVFHPPAAAVVGQFSGSRRSLGVSLFFLAGMVGGMAGNVLTPQVVRWLGTLAGGRGEAGLGLGLQWHCLLIVPGVLAAAMLARAIGGAPHRRAGAREAHAALPRRERRLRWAAVWLLYASNVMRFVTNTALIYLFVRWIETLTAARLDGLGAVGDTGIAASVLNGKFQAAMQLGMGSAGLLAGWVLRARHEKASLVIVPLFGAVAIASVPYVSGLDLSHGATVWIGLGLAVLAGAGFGGTVPTVIAMAQRLLPHRTALASGLMMGGAWGVGFLGPPIAEWIEREWSLGAAFVAAASCLTVCAVLCALLPGRVIREA